MSLYEEKEKKAREITRKNMKEIDEFEIEIKTTFELKIKAIEYANFELISDLNTENTARKVSK